ncbi:hypothetical protein NQ176_g1354 [Zarea fungicola]|uniref:Uncharacterized protein n=1 Tax=Zarea fungicola TaxID=93591 RepID=A0ACC1NVP4_9HYPO|nr:hypothetical protein NQ176_g1354 [Lecanicillium fungicola]
MTVVNWIFLVQAAPREEMPGALAYAYHKFNVVIPKPCFEEYKKVYKTDLTSYTLHRLEDLMGFARKKVTLEELGLAAECESSGVDGDGSANGERGNDDDDSDAKDDDADKESSNKGYGHSSNGKNGKDGDKNGVMPRVLGVTTRLLATQKDDAMTSHRPVIPSIQYISSRIPTNGNDGQDSQYRKDNNDGQDRKNDEDKAKKGDHNNKQRKGKIQKGILIDRKRNNHKVKQTVSFYLPLDLVSNEFGSDKTGEPTLGGDGEGGVGGEGGTREQGRNINLSKQDRLRQTVEAGVATKIGEPARKRKAAELQEKWQEITLLKIENEERARTMAETNLRIIRKEIQLAKEEGAQKRRKAESHMKGDRDKIGKRIEELKAELLAQVKVEMERSTESTVAKLEQSRKEGESSVTNKIMKHVGKSLDDLTRMVEELAEQCSVSIEEANEANKAHIAEMTEGYRTELAEMEERHRDEVKHRITKSQEETQSTVAAVLTAHLKNIHEQLEAAGYSKK